MYYRPRSPKRYRSFDYLMPFLIVICVGVIIVLLFNLWKAIFAPDTSGGGFMHISSGSVQMKTWGTEDFIDLSADALLFAGDEIKTPADGKIIVELFDGTLVRLGGGSYVIFSELDEDHNEVKIMLVNGKIWINKLYKDTENTGIVVQTNSIIVNSTKGSIFEVESDFDEVARVLRGDEIMVDIMYQDGEKIIETEEIGVGQEIVFTDKVLARYWAHQSPSVLDAVSDEFKKTDWYMWNIAEDKAPTQFSMGTFKDSDIVEVAPEDLILVDEEVLVDEEEGDVVEDEAVADEAEVKEADPVVETPDSPLADYGTLSAPVLTSVAGGTTTNENGFYVVTSNLATLVGTVSGAEKVVVNGYTLQKFLAGGNTWTYYANADYNLMQKGENTYEVYALAPDGTRSPSAFVKVLYQPPAPVVV